jgi:hypothetical protein
MEQRQDFQQCGICGHELDEEHNNNLCQRCEDAWEREVDCAW